MGLAAFNRMRMRQVEEMKPENIIAEATVEEVVEPVVEEQITIEEVVENNEEKESKTTKNKNK